jgi:hypothetical protein
MVRDRKPVAVREGATRGETLGERNSRPEVVSLVGDVGPTGIPPCAGVRAVVAERACAALEPSGRSLSHQAIDQSKRLEALKQVDRELGSVSRSLASQSRCSGHNRARHVLDTGDRRTLE